MKINSKCVYHTENPKPKIDFSLQAGSIQSLDLNSEFRSFNFGILNRKC